MERGIRCAGFTAPIWMARDWIDALDHADAARADAHLHELRERPVSIAGWRRLNRRRRRRRGAIAKKVNLPRETLPDD